MSTALSSLLILALASSSAVVYAKPIARQTATPLEWCSLLSSNFDGFENASGFTLAAFNTTGDTTIGAPLGVVGDSTDPGAIFQVLSIYPSDVIDPVPTTFSLVEGGLIGSVPPYQAVAVIVDDGSEVDFFLETTLEVPPNPIWCGTYDTDPNGGTANPTLWVNEDADSFALCPVGNGQTSIIYKPTADNDSGYDVNDCYSVTIQVIQ